MITHLLHGKVQPIFTLPAGIHRFPALNVLSLQVVGSVWQPHRYVDLQHVRKAVNEALGLGLRVVELAGCNPMQHPELVELIDILAAAGVSISLETDGNAIDLNKVRHFAGKQVHSVAVRLGEQGQAPSLSWLDPGHRCHSIVAGIRAFADCGVQPLLHCSISADQGYETIVRIVELASQLSCLAVQFHVSPACCDHPNQFFDLYRQVAGVLKIRDIVAAINRSSPVRVYVDLPVAFYTVQGLLDDPLPNYSIHSKLAMLAGGELTLYGLDQAETELIFGHIASSDLETVWQYAPGLTRLRNTVPARLQGICGECLLKTLCEGKDVADNFRKARRLAAPHWFCQQADRAGLFPKSRRL